MESYRTSPRELPPPRLLQEDTVRGPPSANQEARIIKSASSVKNLGKRVQLFVSHPVSYGNFLG